MKCSEQWLREWVNPNLPLNVLCNMLTMAGLEVEEVQPVADNFTGVVIGQIKYIKPHELKSSLHICQVDVGKETLLNIVCGAKNLTLNMKIPVALIGAQLGNKQISLLTIYEQESEGVLCSAEELGLPDEGNEGLLALPENAPIGDDLRTYLNLNDVTIDISLTPNRGDCLSIRGLAREIAALTSVPLQSFIFQSPNAEIKDQIPVTIEAKEACTAYVGRVIRDIQLQKSSPL